MKLCLIIYKHFFCFLQLNKHDTSLRSKVANVNLLLEKLRVKKDERLRKFTDIRSQIEKIRAEISGSTCESDGFVKREDHDLSLRRLEEFQAQLQYLQREKVFTIFYFLLQENIFNCFLTEIICTIHVK